MAKKHSNFSIDFLFRWIMQRMANFYGRLFLCTKGDHRHLKRSAVQVDGYWHSRCRSCGVHMTRIKKRKWIAAEKECYNPVKK